MFIDIVCEFLAQVHVKRFAIPVTILETSDVINCIFPLSKTVKIKYPAPFCFENSSMYEMLKCNFLESRILFIADVLQILLEKSRTYLIGFSINGDSLSRIRCSKRFVQALSCFYLSTLGKINL